VIGYLTRKIMKTSIKLGLKAGIVALAVYLCGCASVGRRYCDFADHFAERSSVVLDKRYDCSDEGQALMRRDIFAISTLRLCPSDPVEAERINSLQKGPIMAIGCEIIVNLMGTYGAKGFAKRYSCKDLGQITSDFTAPAKLCPILVAFPGP